MMVLIVFNIIVPTGWQVGLIRVEDVVVGALVGVVVSLLLWPRGAGASVNRAIDAACAVGSPPAGYRGAGHPRRLRGGGEPGDQPQP